MSSQVCPSCLNSTFETLIDFRVMPRTGYFLSSPDQSYPTLNLSFEFCSQCALMRRITDEEEGADYTEVNRKTDRQLPNYATDIVSHLEKIKVDKNELVIEIGANDGTFLNLLAASGFKKCLAVEPSIALATICHENGHQIWNTHLDEKQALKIQEKWGLASLVVCRHTLEHVPDPRALLLAMRSLLAQDGILLIEVPDAEVITHNLQGQELWDEHLHYFRVDNLSLILANTGFRVEEIQQIPQRSSSNIIGWCRLSPSDRETISPLTQNPSAVEACRRFRPHWLSLSDRLLEAKSHWKKPIVAIGASHLQSNFLQFTQLGSSLDLLIDDDPHKLGRYVPLPQPVRVISTAQLLNGATPGTIIRTAFGYDQWMDKICQPLGQKGVQIIEPLDFLTVKETAEA